MQVVPSSPDSNSGGKLSADTGARHIKAKASDSPVPQQIGQTAWPGKAGHARIDTAWPVAMVRTFTCVTLISPYISVWPLPGQYFSHFRCLVHQSVMGAWHAQLVRGRCDNGAQRHKQDVRQ